MKEREQTSAIIENNLREKRTETLRAKLMLIKAEGRGQGGSDNRCSVPISKTSPRRRTCFEPLRGTMHDGTRVSIDSLKLFPSFGEKKRERRRKRERAPRRLFALHTVVISPSMPRNILKITTMICTTQTINDPLRN